jgi:hypothetical protein
LVQIHADRIVRVQRPGDGNQYPGEVREDAPVAGFVGVGQRGAGNLAAQPQVVELRVTRAQARFDVAQTFAISQLGESQTEKLIPTGEPTHFVVAAIADNTALELLRMNPIEQLSQNEFAGVHDRKIAAPWPAAESPDSNRSHYSTELWPASINSFMTSQPPITRQL